MKLIPFLGFGKRPRRQGRERGIGLADRAPRAAHRRRSRRRRKKKRSRTRRAKEEEDDERPISNDDEMLKVFMTVDEEFVDNSGLTSQMEDVPGRRAPAGAAGAGFGVRHTRRGDAGRGRLAGRWNVTAMKVRLLILVPCALAVLASLVAGSVVAARGRPSDSGRDGARHRHNSARRRACPYGDAGGKRSVARRHRHCRW